MEGQGSEGCTHMNFDEKLIQSVQNTVIDFIKKGQWITLDYNDRVKFDASTIREIYSKVDMDTVINIVKDKVEQKIADNIINSITTEISTDIKSIMSNGELREDIRSVIRSKIREIKTKLS